MKLHNHIKGKNLILRKDNHSQNVSEQFFSLHLGQIILLRFIRSFVPGFLNNQESTTKLSLSSISVREYPITIKRENSNSQMIDAKKINIKDDCWW